MAKYTVIYGTNVTIPDKKGNPKVITFFQDVDAIDKNAAEFYISQQINIHHFLKDNGGYLRRTSTIVSFKVEERVSMTNTIINSGGTNK